MNLKSTITLLVILFTFVGKSHADDVVASNLLPAQNYVTAFEEVGLIAPNYNNYNNVSKGQTFIPNVSGVLTEVDALVIRGEPNNVTAYPPLRVSIFTSNAGIPMSHLATIQVPRSSFSPFVISGNFRETFDFRNHNIALTAAAEYMVVFATQFGVVGTGGSESPYLIGWPSRTTKMGLSASQARDGIIWERFGDSRELAIEVRADIIPEPSALALMLFSAVALLIKRY
jgi:hypothetical protein